MVKDGKIQVLYADLSVPALWESACAGAATEMKDYSKLVRLAVGMGRYLQDPLMMYAAVFENRAILSLPVHPLQTHLPQEERYAALERVMITVTNQVRAAPARPKLLKTGENKPPDRSDRSSHQCSARCGRLSSVGSRWA